jgi:hypothetical protein
MGVRTKLAAYGAVLAVTFGAGAAIGAAVGPDADDEPVPVVTEPASDHDVHES